MIDLVERAEKLVDEQIGYFQHQIKKATTSGLSFLNEDFQIQLNSWLTHLAEFMDLQAKLAETGKAVTHDYMKMELGNLYRKQLDTKAQRLLGEDTK